MRRCDRQRFCTVTGDHHDVLVLLLFFTPTRQIFAAVHHACIITMLLRDRHEGGPQNRAEGALSQCVSSLAEEICPILPQVTGDIPVIG